MTYDDTPDAADGAERAVPASLSSLLASLDTGAYVVDATGAVVAVNARAEKLLGRPARKFRGRDAHELLHRSRYGATLPRAQCGMRQAYMAGRTVQSEEEWFERGDGSLMRVSWLVTPCRTDDGTVRTLVLFHAPHDPEETRTPGDRFGSPLPELERLALLAETTTQLTATLDVEQALRRLVRLVVPQLADWAVVDLAAERGRVRRSTVVHAEGGDLVRRDDLEGPLSPPSRRTRCCRWRGRCAGSPPRWTRPPRGSRRTPRSGRSRPACSRSPASTRRPWRRSAGCGRYWAP